MSLNILDITIDPLTTEQALEQLSQRLAGKQKTFVATINPEFIMAARQDRQFKDILNQADLRLADGVGVLWAANVLNYRTRLNLPILRQLEVLAAGIVLGFGTLWSTSVRYSIIPEKVTGSELSPKLAQRAAQQGWSMFLLGGAPGTAEGSARKLTQLYPPLKIAGVFAGDGSPNGDAETVGWLQKSPADIVLVAYGAPKQEFWIARNFSQIPPLVAIGVGGTLSYLSGASRRPPQFIRALGLEWLFRLITEPWRLRRQLALPQFIIAVLGRRISRSDSAS